MLNTKFHLANDPQGYVDAYLKWLEKNNLDLPDCEFFRMHDYVHVLTDLGVSYPEEGIVAMVEQGFVFDYDTAAINYSEISKGTEQLSREQYQCLVKFYNILSKDFVELNYTFFDKVNQLLAA
jgi:hypothetical protein